MDDAIVRRMHNQNQTSNPSQRVPSALAYLNWIQGQSHRQWVCVNPHHLDILGFQIRLSPNFLFAFFIFQRLSRVVDQHVLGHFAASQNVAARPEAHDVARDRDR